MQPKFVRKDGYLTIYAYLCRYVETASIDDNKIAIRLYYENGAYHVKAMAMRDFEKVWKVFNNRNEALKLFKKIVKERKATHNLNYHY